MQTGRQTELSRAPTIGVDLPGVVLAFCSMLLTGGYLVAYKRYFASYPTLLYLGIVEAAALGWYLAVGTVLGRPVPVPGGVDVVDAVVTLGVVTATVGSAVASVRALQRGAVSYVAPLSRLAPPVVLVVEVTALDARVSSLQGIGLCVVTVGVYVLNRAGTDGGLFDPFVRVVRARPAQLAMLSAVLIGLADVGKRALLSTGVLAPQTLVTVTLAGLTLGTLPFGLRRWGERPRTTRGWLGFLAAGLVLAAADHLTALAFRAAPASVVVPVLSAGAVVAVVLGGELLDEDDVARRTLAAVAVAAGVTLVALG